MYQIVTPPYALPVDVAEIRAHVKQDITDDDAILTSWVDAARLHAEAETRTQVVAARWKLVMDRFPPVIYIGKGPVLNIVSIQYLDMGGTLQTLDPSLYVVDYASPRCRITPPFGRIWPIALPQIGAVVVTFDAGYIAPVTFSGSNMSVKGWPQMVVGDVVRLSNSGGALPAELSANVDYYIVYAIGNVYQLSLTAGGVAITTSGAGTGTHYIGNMPTGMISWIKLRADSLYENRGETSVVRGAFAPLPYADRLLDPYRVLVL